MPKMLSLLNSTMARTKLITMTISAHTLDSIPTDKPERIVVAGPVSVDSTISLTGGFFVDVKYEVKGLNATARPTPIAVSIPMRQSPTYASAKTKAQKMVKTLDTSYERNMDSSAS